MRGNFAPVKDEIQYPADNIVEGKLPTDINGTFLKNGPNPALETLTNRAHWFGGSGMIHAFQLHDGKLSYCNRFTQTNKFVQEK